MAFEIPDHFHKEFTTNVELLLQEKEPKLLRAVMTEGYSGESAQVVKQFGEVEFQEKTTRHSDTQNQDIQHKQRWIFPTDYVLPLYVDKEDELRMLDSPQSPYVEAMRAAYARKVNSVIAAAALGAARTGKNGDTSTAFDTANQQIVHGSAGLTIAKMVNAAEILGLNEVDEDEEKFLIVGQKQISNLLNDTTVTSADYNTIKALVMGDINTFMGFEFIKLQSLALSGTTRSCIAMPKSAMVFGQWNGLEVRIDPRPDKNYLTQIHGSATIAATRTQEEKVVEVQCTET